MVDVAAQSLWRDTNTALMGNNLQAFENCVQQLSPTARYHTLIKRVLREQRWGMVDILLPHWNPKKVPLRLFAECPQPLLEKVLAEHPLERKSLIECFFAGVRRGRMKAVETILPLLKRVDVEDLHNPLLWKFVGQNGDAQMFDLLRARFTCTAANIQDAWYQACAARKWTFATQFTVEELGDAFFSHFPRLLHMQDNPLGLYLPQLSNAQIERLVLQSLSSSFLSHTSFQQLKVWTSGVCPFQKMGRGIEHLMRFAVLVRDWEALDKLTPHYISDEQENTKRLMSGLTGGHILNVFIVSVSKGEAPLSKILPYVEEILKREPSNNGMVSAIVAGAAKILRDPQHMELFDLLRAFATDRHSTSKALEHAVRNRNDVVVEHLVSHLSDEAFQNCVADLQQTLSPPLSQWAEPFLQPRSQQIVLRRSVGEGALPVKRKM